MRKLRTGATSHLSLITPWIFQVGLPNRMYTSGGVTSSVQIVNAEQSHGLLQLESLSNPLHIQM